MPTHAFSVGEVLKAGWKKFREQPATWIGALIILFIVYASQPFVQNLITGGENENYPHPGIVILLSIIYILIDLGLTLGLIYMGIRAADNLPVHLGHLFARFHYVFHYLIAKIVFSLIVLAGLILLVFPAAIWGTRFGLFPLFIADKGSGPIESLELSSSASKGAKWDLFAFYLTSFLIFLAGIAVVFLGILIAMPPIYVAWGYIYRRLTTPTTLQPVVITPPLPSTEGKVIEPSTGTTIEPSTSETPPTVT
ncbi:hypothetical protein [Candidatus Protochlamydia phocaeensis]|uniref:hypothetical protein n=1 Tax=Candidatus Protochlamydia phocaeensis TaxID=1414722 RepID=UPI0008383BDD|nr:hypothetical protein [Candidatus Protochlamydia phocaeensis]